VRVQHDTGSRQRGWFEGFGGSVVESVGPVEQTDHVLGVGQPSERLGAELVAGLAGRQVRSFGQGVGDPLHHGVEPGGLAGGDAREHRAQAVLVGAADHGHLGRVDRSRRLPRRCQRLRHIEAVETALIAVVTGDETRAQRHGMLRQGEKVQTSVRSHSPVLCRRVRRFAVLEPLEHVFDLLPKSDPPDPPERCGVGAGAIDCPVVS
jgi:hypothetical protein